MRIHENQHQQRLFTPPQGMWRDIMLRTALVTVLIALTVVLLWLVRDGLTDGHDGFVSLLDIIYFAVITVTTVGFGDIVPVSDLARSIVTFAVTPIRVAVWLIFLSTAYQLYLRQRTERIRLALLKKNMKDHTIICGYGVKGRIAAEELVQRGENTDAIIVIDTNEESVERANRAGITALRGDAASGQMLKDAGLMNAKQVIVAADVDGATVLICLTCKDLNPDVRVIAAAREMENVRLMYRSGADAVIAPSVSGGRMLAAATESPITAAYMEDFMHHGGGYDAVDRKVTEEEVGMRVGDLPDLKNAIILGLRTESGDISVRQLHRTKLHEGDTIVAILPPDDGQTEPDPALH
jgi:voltage-gated potassium channel